MNTTINQVKEDCIQNQGDSRRGDKMWSEFWIFRYFEDKTIASKSLFEEYSDALKVGYELKRQIKDDFKGLGN